MLPQAAIQLQQTLSSGYVGEGPKVKEFESKLEAFLGTSRLLATNSCTSALHLALHLVKGPRAEGPQAEVIAPPNTCIAVASAAFHNGFKIRWCDIETNSYNLDLSWVQKHLNENTRAVIVPYFCGTPIDLNRLYNILRRHYNITGKVVRVIEDCAHAFGSQYRGDYIGAHHKDINYPHEHSIKCFSFQAVKLLTCGDGGAIVLPDDKLYEKARKLRWYGIDRNQDRYSQSVESLGFKFHMNDIAATIGVANLEGIEEAIQIQKDNRRFYSENLDLKRLAIAHGEEVSASALYPVWVDNLRTFREYMVRHGVEVDRPHGNLTQHACLPDGEFLSNANHIQVACIPAGWWISNTDRERITKLVREYDG